MNQEQPKQPTPEEIAETEKFNPSDPRYKKVADLPEKHQKDFIDVPQEDGGGFVSNTLAINTFNKEGEKDGVRPINKGDVDFFGRSEMDQLHSNALGDNRNLEATRKISEKISEIIQGLPEEVKDYFEKDPDHLFYYNYQNAWYRNIKDGSVGSFQTGLGGGYAEHAKSLRENPDIEIITDVFGTLYPDDYETPPEWWSEADLRAKVKLFIKEGFPLTLEGIAEFKKIKKEGERQFWGDLEFFFMPDVETFGNMGYDYQQNTDLFKRMFGDRDIDSNKKIWEIKD